MLPKVSLLAIILSLNIAYSFAQEPEQTPEEQQQPPAEAEQKPAEVPKEEISELKKLLSDIDEKLGERDAPKFYLNPTKFFAGFSLGANFDFLDGFNDNTLYGDLEVNTGTFIKNLNLQLGANRGRVKSFDRDSEADYVYQYDFQHPENPDSIVTNYIKSTERINSDVISDRANIYARLNYKVIDNDNFHLYLSTQFEFLSITQNITNRFSYLVNDTVATAPNGSVLLPIIDFKSDTVKATQRYNFFYPSIGFTILKESDDIDFIVTNTFGFVKQERRYRFEEEFGFTYVAKATVLEKKAIGAKLGFEFRYSSNRLPDTEYFFFIAKQFSMVEFFKIFKP